MYRETYILLQNVETCEIQLEDIDLFCRNNSTNNIEGRKRLEKARG